MPREIPQLRTAFAKSYDRRSTLLQHTLEPGRGMADFIKRIVGTPGDVVQVKANQVLVNAQALDEPYLRLSAPSPLPGGQAYCGYAYGCEPLPVPADSYFVMGDDRNNSQDSRYWGFVRGDRIKGRVVTVYWSWDGGRHRLRLERIGLSVM